nr:acyl-CoA dehydrogenase family protein [Pseudoglutamicibacter albus]
MSTHTPVHPAAGAEIAADAEASTDAGNASTAVSSADLSFAEGLRYVTTQDAPVTPWEAGHKPSLAELREHFGPIFDRIASGASEREAHRVLPFVEIAELNRAGFTVLRVPTEYGGPGVSFTDWVQLLIDLAAADPNIAHQYRSHAGFVETLRYQDEQTRQYWYAKVLAGDVVGNASTEIGGNALNTLNTTLAVQADGTGVLNGAKYYCTGTAYATHTRVSATLLDADGTPTEGRQFAVVSTRAPGVELEDDWNGFGQSLTGTGTTRFTDVKVAPEHILNRVPGSAEAQFEAPLFQLVLLAVLAGIARNVVDDAAAGVRRRTRSFNTGLGVPHSEDPQILGVVGRLSAQAFVVESAVVEAARRLEAAEGVLSLEGEDAGTGDGNGDADTGAAATGNTDAGTGAATDTAQRLLTEAELAVERAHVTVPGIVTSICSDLFLTGGASNTSREKNLDRHWRNAQTVATHNPLVFRERIIGDYLVNGTVPEGLNAIGEVRRAS